MKEYILSKVRNHLNKHLSQYEVFNTEEFINKYVKIEELELVPLQELIFDKNIPIGIKPLSQKYKVTRVTKNSIDMNLLEYDGDINGTQKRILYDVQLIEISRQELRNEQLKSIGI